MKLRYFSKRRRRQNEAAILLRTSFRAVRPSRPWVGMVICGYVSRPLPAARPRLATAAPAGPDSVWPRTGQIRVAGPPGIGPGRGPDAALARLVLVKRPSRPWPLVTWIGSKRLARSLARELDTSTQNVLRPQGPFLAGRSRRSRARVRDPAARGEGHELGIKTWPPRCNGSRDRRWGNPSPDSGDHHRRPMVGVMGMDQEKDEVGPRTWGPTSYGFQKATPRDYALLEHQVTFSSARPTFWLVGGPGRHT